MKIHIATTGILCLTILTASACVTRTTYDAAVTELAAMKSELDSTAVQSHVLTEQVSELEQLKIDLAQQMEAAWSALQRATQQKEAEHTALQVGLSKLNRMLRQMTAQQSNLRYVLGRATDEQIKLQSMADSYKPQLGEAEGGSVLLSSPPVASTNESPEIAIPSIAQGTVQPDPTSQPLVTPPVASADQIVDDQNPQPASSQSSGSDEDDWLSILKGWAISLWRLIFS